MKCDPKHFHDSATMHSIQQTRLQSLLDRVPKSLEMPLAFMKICYLLISRMEITLRPQPLLLLCEASRLEASSICAEVDMLSGCIAANMDRLAHTLEAVEALAPPDPPPLTEIIGSIRIHAEHVLACRDQTLRVLERFLTAETAAPGPSHLISAFNPVFCMGVRSELGALQGQVNEEICRWLQAQELT